MLVLHDESTCLHRTVEVLGAKIIPALECPERIRSILAVLGADIRHEVRGIAGQGLGTELENILSSSHDPGYLEHLRTCHGDWVRIGAIGEDESVLPECFPVRGLSTRPQPPKDAFARPGYYAFDLSTGICKDTWSSAVASAGLALEAARIIAGSTSGSTRDVLALCRPPGHHCTTALAGGYCYLNNAVVAVEALRRYSSPEVKVAILDLDFHHGNGTQSYFYADPLVLYVSIHGENEYPYYTGFENETGEGPGEGANLNLPLPPRSSTDEYGVKVDASTKKIQSFKPSYLVVSLGFDTFCLDPLGSFNLQTEDYEAIAARVRHAAGIGGLPSLLLLEGGYVLEHLGENMSRFLKGWESEG